MNHVQHDNHDTLAYRNRASTLEKGHASMQTLKRSITILILATLGIFANVSGAVALDPDVFVPSATLNPSQVRDIR